jgi:HEAT repeat protein
MLISFKCGSCQKSLAADRRLAGDPLFCPVCRGAIVVPTASDPLALCECAALVETPAPPVAEAPRPTRPDSRRVGLRAAVVAATVMVLLGGYLTSKDRALQRDAQEAETLARIEALLKAPAPLTREAPAPDRATVVLPVVAETPPPPQVREELQVRLLPERLTQVHEDIDEKRIERIEKVAPPLAAGPDRDLPPAPAESKPVLKRRQPLGEEELLRQLAAAPEMGLTPQNISAVVQRFAVVFQASGGTNFEPKTVLSIRPDLMMLPMRDGVFSRLSLPAAVNLQVLSQKLHHFLKLAMPRDLQGNRPDPQKLREVMRAERRGPRPEWLCAEAIPTLLQLLMHEDRPLRLLLVELLAEIEGRTASVALAQRAVFDLSPEVREAAVQALAKRPPQEYRHVFLSGLRYPWAPAADHAAEALTALGDREAVPHLVGLLKEPDPAAPVLARDQFLVREIVKLKHTNNCLTCHPPAGTGGDPVPGIVPGQKLVRVSTRVRQNPPKVTSPPRGPNAGPSGGGAPPAVPVTGGGGAAGGGGGGYGGGGGSSSGSSVTIAPPSPPSGPTTASRRGGGSGPVLSPGGQTVTTKVDEAPLLVRADITYVRQDFSVQLPVAHPAAPSADRRFDYVVRTRVVSAQEVLALRQHAGGASSYPQREAVLFALRELTGKDVGPSTESWLEVYPTAEFDVQVARLSDEVVEAAAGRREQFLVRLREGKGVAYTQALAAVIPRLTGHDQARARNLLAERLVRMNAETLRDKLQDESAEVRRAAAIACALKESTDHIPDVMTLLEDPEPDVTQSAGAALKRLTDGRVEATASGDGG